MGGGAFLKSLPMSFAKEQDRSRLWTPWKSALGAWNPHCGTPPNPLPGGRSNPVDSLQLRGSGPACKPPATSSELSALAPGFPSYETRLPACLPTPLAAHTLSSGVAAASWGVPQSPSLQGAPDCPQLPQRGVDLGPSPLEKGDQLVACRETKLQWTKSSFSNSGTNSPSLTRAL